MQSSILEIEKPERLKIEYSIIGEGKPLLFLHGGSSYHRFYEFFLNTLSEHYKVYAFTMPGFSKSSSMRNGTSDNYLLITDEFVKHFKLDKFYLVGQSLGGATSIAYAATYPKKVEKLVLISPFINKYGGSMLSMMQRLSKSRDMTKDKFPELYKNKRSGWKKIKHLIESYKVFHMIKKFDVENKIPMIQAKTLIVIGDIDPVLEPAMQYKAGSIKDSKIINYQNGAHNIFFTHKDAIVKEITDFLNG